MAFLSTVSFSSALFLSLLAFPRVGIFVALFSGVPLVLAQLRYPDILLGTGAMVTSGGVIFLLGTVLHSPLPGLQVLIYVGWCGLPALVTAEFLKRRSGIFPMILTSMVQILFFTGGLWFYIYSKTHGQLLGEIEKSLHQAVNLVIHTAIQNSQNTLAPTDQARIEALEPLIYKTLIGLFPGLLGGFALMTSIVLWATSIGVMERSGEDQGVVGIDRWILPDPLIFGLVASLALLVIPVFSLRLWGTNFLMVFASLYAGQGAGVLLSYIRKKKLGAWFWLVAGIFVLLQPLFLLILSFVGVLDLWMDFRQLRGSSGRGGESGETGIHADKKKSINSDKNDSDRGSSEFRSLCGFLWKTGFLGNKRGLYLLGPLRGA
jgi:uncharacterized protein YybS (DUF2232 family)